MRSLNMMNTGHYIPRALHPTTLKSEIVHHFEI
uniref:Uncharacterized protein n=1 Tax=Lepeophtheirus salmonis TaxID=72036 RepID=A0A0K2U0L0_LEPSM